MTAIRTLAQLLVQFADNATKDILADHSRDLSVSTKSGWAAYEDDATKTTPLNGTANTPLDMSCDGAGANSSEVSDHLPFGASAPDALWDTTDDKLLLSSMQLYDQFDVRFNADVTPVSVNSVSLILFNFYTSGDVYLFSLTGNSKYQKTTDEFNLSSDTPAYVGSGLVGGYVTIQLLSDSNFTVIVGGVFVSVTR